MLLSVIVTSILIFALSGNVSLKGGEPIKMESVDLEDAIIIRELKMTSEKAPDDDEDDDAESRGRIIYDDDFKSTVEGLRNGAGRAMNKGDKKVSLMDELRKKNPRWHLTEYKIRKNDNIWNIAKKFRVGHRLIIEANDITHPDMLLPGNTIKVPNKTGIFYVVKSGDSVKKISAAHRVEAEKIIAQNGTGRLRAGTKIFIPDAVAPKPAAVAVRNGAEERGANSGRISFMWPLTGKLTSGFGVRRDPFSDKSQFHNGIDISADIGKKIRASAAGRVIFSGWQAGYGNVVILKHDLGYITVYAHNSKNLVQENGAVKKGDIIALTGMTGAVTGAHLHFELRKYVTPLNPLRLLR